MWFKLLVFSGIIPFTVLIGLGVYFVEKGDKEEDSISQDWLPATLLTPRRQAAQTFPQLEIEELT